MAWSGRRSPRWPRWPRQARSGCPPCFSTGRLTPRPGSRADGTRGLRLLGYLARRPLWLAGILLAAGAYGLQGLALAYGPLALVAPIVATDLLFAVPLAAWWSRRPMRPRDLTGCALVAAGVGTFLATSPPAAGRSDAPARTGCSRSAP